MSKRVLKMGILAMMLLTSVIATFLNKPTAAQLAADIVAYETDQKIVIDGVANEAVWLVAPSVEIPLTRMTGYTARVTITAVHNGTHIFILAQWPDPTESRIWHDKGNPPYEDRLSIMFEIATEMTYPCMDPIAAKKGATTDGEVDLLHWHAARDDPNGLNYTEWAPNPPYPYASDQYSNTTKRYRDDKAGGSHWDWPAKGEWTNSTPTETWTLELMRKFTTGDSLDVQFSANSTIDASFAVFDGGNNETHETKSTSNWYTLEISSESLLSLITGPQGPAGEAGAPAPEWISYTSIGAIAIAVIAIAISLLKKS